MKQQLHFIILGVHDLDAMKNWYMRKFGWQPVRDSDGITFFKLNGLILGLFPFQELAKDIGVNDNGSGFKKISLAINFLSEKEVDDSINELRKHTVKIIKEPQRVFWGGYTRTLLTSKIIIGNWHITSS